MAIDLVSLNDTDSGLTVDLDNTADYSESERGIIANLDTAKVLSPVYEITEQPKILTLGDSITAGTYPTEPTPGSYRIQLGNNFKNDNLSIDFIGSQTNEITDLPDPEHEGHPGWTIDKLTTLVNDGSLTEYQPDVVLLMAGTNDIIKSDSSSQVIADLNQLIDSLQTQLPDVKIFVSSLAPLDSAVAPSIISEAEAKIVNEVNALLPDLAEQQGEGVTYVNGAGLLSTEDLVADGIHPNAAGYQAIGNAWYDALVGRDTLTGVEHITGTGFSDRLTGNDQANILFGNGGADTLSGGEGSDRFLYENLDSETDTITDFSDGDQLVISAAGFNASLGIETSLTEVVLVSDLNPSSATGASFLYQTDTGLLSFDPDGNGSIAASDIAVLSNRPSLSQEQISVIA
ncbi:MAG: GDSL-type esterase/lipase family protein [Waterburya sp.]